MEEYRREMHSSKLTPRGFVYSLSCAVRGMGRAWMLTPHMRLQTVIYIVALVAAWWLGLPLSDKILIVIVGIVVLGFEGVNTALERIVDLVSPGYHPIARDIKDIAAGVVLVASLGALAVGVLIFLPALGLWG